jgi:hypothetical protein
MPKKQGKGIFKTGVRKLTNSIHTVKSVVTKAVYGRNGYSPENLKVINQYGNNIIQSIRIVRNPVQPLITTAFNAVSLGQFEERIRKEPYDKLFHLALHFKLDNGIIISYEKEEAIKIKINPSLPPKAELMEISTIPDESFKQFIDNNEAKMGNAYFIYRASHSNCQDFVFNALHANGINSPQYDAFVKQNTSQLFDDNLRKITNTITDIGGAFDVLSQGGSIKRKRIKGTGVAASVIFADPNTNTNVHNILVSINRIYAEANMNQFLHNLPNLSIDVLKQYMFGITKAIKQEKYQNNDVYMLLRETASIIHNEIQRQNRGIANPIAEA